MGQYYKFMNIDKKERCKTNKIGGLKLTEHSYLANEHCMDILYLLSDRWKGDRVIHVGDYANSNDGTITEKIVGKIQNELKSEATPYNLADYFKEIDITEKIPKIRYVYNHSKKEYIDLFKQPIQWYSIKENKIYSEKINSFALLIACGNSTNGGDYWKNCVNSNKVGSWAGDRLESSILFLDKYIDYKENTLIFNEVLNKYIFISNWNENNGLNIVNDEKYLLDKEIEYHEQNHKNFDIKKLQISREGLTDIEYSSLKSHLKELQNKKSLENHNDLNQDADKELELCEMN